jgi:hypothetical protein
MKERKKSTVFFEKLDSAMDGLVESAIKGFGRGAGLSVYAVAKKTAEVMNRSKKKYKLSAETKIRLEAFFIGIDFDSIQIVEEASLPANMFKDNIAGMTFGHTIYTIYKNSQEEYFALFNLIHELVHVEQIELLGEHEFAGKYGEQFVNSGGYGEKMPFEAEAYGFVRNIPFEPFYYMNQYPEVKELVKDKKEDAFLHWLDYGILQDKQASRNFKPSAYLTKNPDVERICGKGNYKAAIRHWLRKGIKEGRKGI